jgi:hypothetical protein
MLSSTLGTTFGGLQMSEQGIVHNLHEEILVMKNLAEGRPEQHAIGYDLLEIRPHADPLSFYFSVKAADANLLQEVNLLGAGHEGLFTADHIYSDVSYLQSQYDYWLV